MSVINIYKKFYSGWIEKHWFYDALGMLSLLVFLWLGIGLFVGAIYFTDSGWGALILIPYLAIVGPIEAAFCGWALNESLEKGY